MILLETPREAYVDTHLRDDRNAAQCLELGDRPRRACKHEISRPQWLAGRA